MYDGVGGRGRDARDTIDASCRVEDGGWRRMSRGMDDTSEREREREMLDREWWASPARDLHPSHFPLPTPTADWLGKCHNVPDWQSAWEYALPQAVSTLKN